MEFYVELKDHHGGQDEPDDPSTCKVEQAGMWVLLKIPADLWTRTSHPRGVLRCAKAHVCAFSRFGAFDKTDFLKVSCYAPE